MRAAALVLAGATAALAVVGCGHDNTTAVSLRLQRADLALLSHELQRAEPRVARELAATKAAWPLVASGLPADVRALTPPLPRAIAAASAVPLPRLFGAELAGELTGPAYSIAGPFRTYQGLSSQGWRLIGAAVAQIEHGSPAAARFARANVGIYIESVYDSHFALGQIGRKIVDGYRKLEGPAQFGSTLTQAEVDALASVYSDANVRLEPRVDARLGF